MATEEPTTQATSNGSPPANGSTFHSEKDDSYDFPSADTLNAVGEMIIQDEQGKEVPFKSLYQGQEGQQLIIFIRHFFCGSCEQYVQALSESLPPKTLASTTPPTKLTLVGCGEHVCIPDYRTRTMTALGTGETFPIYCDPERKIYEKLNMAINLSQGKQPEYMHRSLVANVAISLKNVVMSGPTGLKGGPAKQNGGEWLFENGNLKWCHRMKNTSDHAEVAELKGILGL